MRELHDSTKFDVKVLKAAQPYPPWWPAPGGPCPGGGWGRPPSTSPSPPPAAPSAPGWASNYFEKKFWRRHPDVQLVTHLDPAVVADGCLHIS